MREVLVEYMLAQINPSDGLSLLLNDNSAYILALVNVSFHLILAFALYFVYLLIEGILFIFYLIWYSEGKHKNKKNERYENNEEVTPYIKYRKYGATIGLFRGVIRGLICMAFIGSLFYITSAVGNKNRATYKTNSEDHDLVLTLYKEIGNYGEHGIFKVLNMCKDKNDVPYYLYAVDLVYQGGLKDENRDLDTNIYLIHELNAYVEFSADTFDLLMKYGSDKLTPIILGKDDGNTLDVVLEIMANPGFQAEFKILINNFDAKTYFINFALSLVDAIANHINEVEFMERLAPEAIDVLSIAFKKGYLSDTIPYERNLKQLKPDTELGYIKPSDLLNANDARIVLNALLEIISLNEIYKNDDNFALRVIDTLTKYINNLSILNTNRSDELNPVLKRLYAFVDSMYLSEEPDVIYELSSKQKLNNIIYINEEYENIDWVKELNILVDSIDDILGLYNDVYANTDDAFTATKSIFEEDEMNVRHTKNLRMFHELVDNLSNSRVLGLAASSVLVNTSIEVYISGNVAPSFKIPSDIVYANTSTDDEIKYGELYYFLTGVEKLCTNKVVINEEELNILDAFELSEDFDEEEVFTLIKELANILARSENNTTFVETLLKSKIIHALFSAYLYDNGVISDDFEIYIDDSIYKNGLIDYYELVTFFKVAPDTLELIEDFAFDDEEDTESILNLLMSEEAEKALSSKIFEGSFSCILASKYRKGELDEAIVVPQSFLSRQHWITKNQYDPSEISKLINALNVTDFDLNALLNEDSDQDISNQLDKLSGNNAKIFLDSNILYYSLSKYLINNDLDDVSDDFEIIIPDVSVIKNNGFERIEKKTLEVFLSYAYMFNDSNSIDIMKELKKNEDALKNTIYSASLAYSLCNEGKTLNNEIKDVLYVPNNIKEHATKTALKFEFTLSNPLRYEMKNLILGTDYLVDLNTINSFDEIDDEKIENGIINISDIELNTIYSSNILAYTVSKKIKESLDEDEEDYIEHIDPAYSIKFNDGTGIYFYDEVESLIHLLRKTNCSNFSDAIDNVDKIVINDELVTDISKSYLITKTFSNRIVENVNVIVISSDYNENYETFIPNALALFLDGILKLSDYEFTIKDASSEMNFDQMHMPRLNDIDSISRSQSLMATITSNIKIKIDGNPVVTKVLWDTNYTYCTKLVDIEGNDRIVIKKNELYNISKMVHTFNATININSLLDGFSKPDNDYPSILKNVVNDYLLDWANAYLEYNDNEEIRDLIDNIRLDNIAVLSTNRIELLPYDKYVIVQLIYYYNVFNY